MADEMSMNEMQLGGDSRKRSLDSDHSDHHSHHKRSHNTPESVFVKQLIPAHLAGAVLGKGGCTVTKLSSETGTVIKMSKGGEFYPATNDRVLIITGAPDKVKRAHELVWDEIYQRIDSSVEDAKIKLVLPHPTIGMIIGKGGSYIKRIKDSTDATVHISAKGQETQYMERLVTFSGARDSQRIAFEMVFQMIVDDPQSGSCPMITYPTGGSSGASVGSSYPYHNNTDMMGGDRSSYRSNNVRYPQMTSNSSSTIDMLKSTLRLSGYTPHAADEIADAMNTLYQYGLLNGYGAGMMGGYGAGGYGNGSMTGGNMGMGGGMGAANAMGGMAGGMGAAAAIGGAGMNFDYLLRVMAGSMDGTGGGDSKMGGNMSGAMGNMGGGMGWPAAVSDGSDRGFGGFHGSGGQVKEELQVSEALVGAVLGPGGSGIVDIQNVTSAIIQISKKGVYAPGTQNRVVTISGSRVAVDNAMYYVKERVAREEQRRAGEGPRK